MNNKEQFLREDYKTYKPKYKPYCKCVAVERVTFEPVKLQKVKLK